jgi:hypothetical protein
MTKYLFCSLSLLLGVLTHAQSVDLSYYLPKDISYNKEIPTPEQVIGHQVGAWHVTHDRLSRYMEVLAEISPRMSIEKRSETYEGRPLWLLTVTAPENQKRLEQIKTERQKLLESNSKGVDFEQVPIVLYQGFSIHGNEPSGSNAALLYAYYLAAAQGPEIEKVLSESVILLDPSFNPDGLQRFSTWANMHKSDNINPDPNDREYSEVWPGGRTNHYWFDLNRDWMPSQLPESQARIETFHQWHPNVLTDHHEMGTNATFFFQPGIPTRTHPLTPKLNQELTRAIGRYHAGALDEIGSLYYSEEDYDDFYYGKGSTFPDIHGGIGILFEQASSRGHAQESDNGVLTFPFTIKNQFTTALSTLKAGIALKKDLMTYQIDFYRNLRHNIGSEEVYLVQDAFDSAKMKAFVELLERQKIEAFRLKEALRLGGKSYLPQSTVAIPKDQMQSTLIEAMFERRTKFQDSLFYDISAWSLPLAFNLDHTSARIKELGEKLSASDFSPVAKPLSKGYAYVLAWEDYNSPQALNYLLEQNVRVKVSMRPFSLGNQTFDYGSLMIPANNQTKSPEEIYSLMQELNRRHKIHSLSTGATQGMNLGSSDFKTIEPKTIALLVGSGINPYDAGEIWHLMDTRYDIRITKLDVDDLARKNLSRYTTIIMPATWGRGPDSGATKTLKSWVEQGGHLIGFRSSANWINNNELLDLNLLNTEKTGQQATFEQQERYRGAQVIGGAIFQASIDRSHPVNFGYKNDKLPLFRNTTIFLKTDNAAANNPIVYDKNPLLSGYISKENLESLSGSSAFKTGRSGRGRVSYFTDNTNFRAFWYGTNKLMMNAIFFGDQM